MATETRSMPLLEVENLRVRLNTSRGPADAVRGVSFALQRGETLGLIGESGSGKSVTALALMGLLPDGAVVSGSIRLDGRELVGLADPEYCKLRGNRISMIFQEPMTALNPVMPAGEQIAEAIRVHNPEMSRRQVREAVLTAMEAVALNDPARRYKDYPHQFSGGQRQRILIAMAIANRPRLLIADEPTTALDVTVQQQILELLASLRHRFGLAMLFISHDLAVVSQVADRVAVMRHGLLLEEASREAIFRDPVHAYTKALLGAVPTMSTDIARPLAVLDRSVDTTPVPLRECSPGHWARADGLN
jgi:peptide/nickel transport system ATP-binding protein